MPSPTHARADQVTVVAGAACVAITLIGVVLSLVHLVPQGLATLVTLACLGIGLRLLLSWSGKTADPARRAKVMRLVSWAGLSAAGVTFVVTLPTLTAAGGLGTFVGDLFAHLWSLLVFTVVAGPVRTLTAGTFAGLWLTGLLAVPALATLVGTPLTAALGQGPLAVAFLLPLSEELLKALPVVVLVLSVARRATVRPSAVDIMLAGMWVGTGYSLYENALFGRGAASLSEVPLLSALLPTVNGQAGGFAMVSAGHMVWTGLIGLGLGVGVLYRRRHRLAWLAAPVAFLVCLAEHATVNSLVLSADEDSPVALAGILRVLTLFGWLSPLLLVGGTVWVVLREWRGATRSPLSVLGLLRLRPAESSRRAVALAARQVPATTGFSEGSVR